jgi:hypothetical protein
MKQIPSNPKDVLIPIRSAVRFDQNRLTLPLPAGLCIAACPGNQEARWSICASKIRTSSSIQSRCSCLIACRRPVVVDRLRQREHQQS